jgi:hypothetical protein
MVPFISLIYHLKSSTQPGSSILFQREDPRTLLSSFRPLTRPALAAFPPTQIRRRPPPRQGFVQRGDPVPRDHASGAVSSTLRASKSESAQAQTTQHMIHARCRQLLVHGLNGSHESLSRAPVRENDQLGTPVHDAYLSASTVMAYVMARNANSSFGEDVINVSHKVFNDGARLITNLSSCVA